MTSAAPVITGLGLATALGGIVESTWNSLLANKAISDHSYSADLEPGDGLRINRLARQVAHQAIIQARWTAAQLKDSALIIGTSKGPVEGWLTTALNNIQKTGYEPAGQSSCFGMAEVAATLADELGLVGGPVLTLSAACASGVHAVIRAAMMLAQGEASRVLVVAAESSLHPLFVQSFRRLGVLPPVGGFCRPFDQNRNGFLMSEAAAAVCLELPDARRPEGDSRAIVGVDRFALGGDGTHLTANDPQNKTLRRLLRQVIDDRRVDLIHAHGTGTQANDALELAAIEAEIPQAEPIPSLYSHKGALGHSLGAAGLVAVVVNCLIHQHGVVPPNVRTEHPIAATKVQISRAPEQRLVQRSIAMAAGFGGPLAAIALADPSIL